NNTISSYTHEGSFPIQKFSWEDFQRLFPESRSLQVARFEGIGDTLAVPLGTQFDGKTEPPGGSPYKRTLLFDNAFVKVEIELTFSSYNGVGIGALGLLLAFMKEEGPSFCP